MKSAFHFAKISVIGLSMAWGLQGFLCSSTAWAEDEPIRIMAVGDSITAGYTDNRDGWTEPFAFGYRSELYSLLTDANYSFDFVGNSGEPWNHETAPPESAVSGFDLRTVNQDNHRGYGGKNVSYISSNIANWITEDNPDVILLMIGINDISMGSTGNPTSVESGLNTLINTVVSTSPDTHLIVAQITPYASYTDSIVQYNNYIANTLVPAYATLGYNVTTVNQYDNLLTDGSIDASLFSNGINHPDATSYASMAQTWFEGIEALNLPKTATNIEPGENNLVSNGSFENPIYSDPHHDYAGGIDGSGWTPTGRAGIDRGNPYGTSVLNSSPSEGSQMAFLQGDLDNIYTPSVDGVTSLTQDVSGFVPGETYTLTFDAKGMKGFNGVNPFRVSVGGTEVTFGGIDLLEPFTTYSIFVSDPIVATSETMTLKFYDEGNVPGGNVSWIDDVRITTAVENLVENGGFETPVQSGPAHNYKTLSDSGWIHEGRSGIGRYNIFNDAAPNCAAAEGVQMAFIQGDLGNIDTPAADGVSKLAQDISGFEIGESYILRFMTMGMDGYDGVNPFYVSMDGTDLFGLITPTLEYEEYVSDAFVATAETMQLMFYDQGNIVGQKVSWIDYVRITKDLTTPEKIPGDANNDGKVDGSDVTILANNWQHGVGLPDPDATWAMGDFNGDGKVDGSDVTILANNWQYGVTTAAATVPEPGVFVLLGSLLLMAVGYRKWK